MNRVGRRAYLSAGVGGLLAPLSGCLSGRGDDAEARPALANRTLRYGIVLPNSGALEAMGGPLRNGAALPAAELEAADAAFDVEYAFADSETSPAGAVDAAATLAEDCPAIVGAAASGVSLQMTQRATIPAEVVSCSPASTSPTMSIINDRGYSFRTAPDDSMQAVVAAQIARAEHGVDSASTLYESGDYGRQLSGAFSASFDGEIQQQVSYDPGRDSYADPIEAALADDPDALFLVGYPESGIPLLTEYYADHERGELLLLSDGMKDDALQRDVEHPMTDAYGTAPVSTGPGEGEFVSLYRDEFGDDPGLFAANSYDAAATVLLANAAAGANEGTAISEQMRAVTGGDGTEILPGSLVDGIERAAAGEPVRYRGASSELEFDENGDGGSIVYEYFEVTDDGVRTIDEVTPEGEGE